MRFFVGLFGFILFAIGALTAFDGLVLSTGNDAVTKVFYRGQFLQSVTILGIGIIAMALASLEGSQIKTSKQLVDSLKTAFPDDFIKK